MIEKENIYHISPNNDEKPHILECNHHELQLMIPPTCNCPCEPKMIEEGEFLFIVHNSFDGREGLEWARDILNIEE